MESVCVEPGAKLHPAFWLVMIMVRIWCTEDEGVDASYRCKSSNIANGIVEAYSIDQVAKHRWVYHACYASTTGHIADGKSSTLRKPCCGHCETLAGFSRQRRLDLPCELETKKVPMPRPMTRPCVAHIGPKLVTASTSLGCTTESMKRPKGTRNVPQAITVRA